MKTIKTKYICGALAFSVALGLSYYVSEIDLAPWGIEPNQKVSGSLSADQTIVEMAKEGNVRNVSVTCGLLDNSMHILIELNGTPTVVNDSKVRYVQQGPCKDHYFKASFIGNKVLWSGYLNGDISYINSIIGIKSTIKGHLAKAQAYAKDKQDYKEGWKIKE